MIKIAYCIARRRKVRSASCTFYKNFSLKKLQLSLRNARNIETNTNKAVAIMTMAKIGGALSLKLVVPKKSLSRYMLRSMNLQF
jgi:hypothetical protein